MKDERARMQTADMKPTRKRMGTEFYGFLRIMWCGVRVQTQLEIPQTPALFPPPPTPFLSVLLRCHPYGGVHSRGGGLQTRQRNQAPKLFRVFRVFRVSKAKNPDRAHGRGPDAYRLLREVLELQRVLFDREAPVPYYLSGLGFRHRRGGNAQKQQRHHRKLSDHFFKSSTFPAGFLAVFGFFGVGTRLYFLRWLSNLIAVSTICCPPSGDGALALS